MKMNKSESPAFNDHAGADGRWLAAETTALAAGTVLPLFHLQVWGKTQPAGTVQQVPIPETSESPSSLVAVQRDASRILPGHSFLRVQRFGHGWPAETWEPIVEALTAIARKDSGVLRLSSEVFQRGGHDGLREVLQRNGFHKVPSRSYRHTLTLEVDQPDEALLATRKSLRQRLRGTQNAGAVVQSLTEEKYAARLIALQQEAMDRSGGTFRIQDWPALLRLSLEHPELSRIVGLFLHEDATEPADMLGFAWGCMHGDHAEYRAAGTAELKGENRSLSISHPLLWDLIRWCRQNGGTWFDMGGVTVKEDGVDPLAGISSAKKVFSQTIEEVGEEWMMEPHPIRSGIARGLGNLIAKVRSMSRRSRSAQ
jgi:hypothetical protein